MREIFRFCFEQLTYYLSLHLDPLVELIALAILHEFVYRLAFKWVGKLYDIGIISGRPPANGGDPSSAFFLSNGRGAKSDCAETYKGSDK